MGASFRSIDQVLGLAGCDLLTISPSLLTQLEQDTRTVDAALDALKPNKQKRLFDQLKMNKVLKMNLTMT